MKGVARSLARLLALAGLLALAACAREDVALPSPLEPGDDAIGYFCGMSLPEHEGPKGQAFVAGRDKPFWFASVSEAFVFLQTDVFQAKELQVLYVNDMGQGSWEKPASGAWIDIHKAVFVIGSSKTDVMSGKEAVPFATTEAALAFIKLHGGEIADFDAAAKALAIDQSGGN